jgi:CCR4-NOT complex subunit CAF16
MSATDPPNIEVQNLSYKFQDGSDGLENIAMSLPAGSRTLLIGGQSHNSSLKLKD